MGAALANKLARSRATLADHDGPDVPGPRPAPEPLPARPNGPYDSAEAADDAPRLDVGTLLVPHRPDARVAVQVAGGVPSEITIDGTADGYELKLSAFAAPRSRGTWADTVAETAAGLRTSGYQVQECATPYGPSIMVAVPEPDAWVALYVFGVDGPGWMLRGTVQRRTPKPAPEEATGDTIDSDTGSDTDATDTGGGEAAVEPAGQDVPGSGTGEEFPHEAFVELDADGMPAAGGFADLFRGVVVRRGDDPYRVGERLPLTVDPVLLLRGQTPHTGQVSRYAQFPPA